LIGQDYWWVLLIKAVVVVLGLTTIAAYLTYAERKVAARIQLRLGPNRVGPFGLLQPAADAVKLLFKENAAPANRDRLLYLVGPSLAGGAAVLAFAVIPMGINNWFNYQFHWDIAHFNVGLLFSLLGGLRSSAQLISYEMAVSFALIGTIILAGSLDLELIVGAQQQTWFIVLQPLAFVLYFSGAFAETNRAPFDLPEAETELVAGYHTEYGSMRFGLYFLGEYVNMVIVSSIATTLFLGGWLPLFPFHPFDWIPGPLWFLGKVVVLLFFMMWVRWTFPRLRYDRLMNFGWKVLLPLGLLNILITGTVVALRA